MTKYTTIIVVYLAINSTQITGSAFMPRELTGPQTINGTYIENFGTGEVRTQLGTPGWITPTSKGYLTYTEVREVRIDPTVKLARMLVVSPALAAGWSVESDVGVPEEIHKAVDKAFVPMHTHIMRTGMLGTIDFGWVPFEKVWDYDPQTGRIVLKKLKQLLQENTVILVDKKTGQYAGLKNKSSDGQTETTLEVPQTLLLYQNVEGTNWYGESDLVAVKPILDQAKQVNNAANAYDHKIAGAHWLIRYPVGKTDYNGQRQVDNAVIAADILSKINSTSGFTLPSTVSQSIQTLNDLTGQPKHEWNIEIIEAKGSANTQMMNRHRYLDALKVRAFGVPERSILEGQHGTLAEAKSHGDFAMTNINIRRMDITFTVNYHVVNHFVRLNWGSQYENMVRLMPNPVSDISLLFVREVYKQLLSDAQVGGELKSAIDLRTIAERVSIPLVAEEREKVRDTVEQIEEGLKQEEEEESEVNLIPT